MTTLVPDLAKAEVAIIELTNQFRRENGLGEVRREPKLDAAARQFADFLARSGLFAHEADGRRFSDRMTAAGYKACLSAENLALIQRDNGFETRELADRFVAGWKTSAGHRKNLLMGPATEIGIGIAKAKTAEKYVSVQLFARPIGLEYQFSVENAAGRTLAYSFAGERVSVEGGETITHTACAPDDVVFAAGALGANSAAMRYPAGAGVVLLLKRQHGGAIGVETVGQAKR